MANEKQENERTVRVTVRISVPEMLVVDVPVFEGLVAGLIEEFPDASYDVSMSSPRPER